MRTIFTQSRRGHWKAAVLPVAFLAFFVLLQSKPWIQSGYAQSATTTLAVADANNLNIEAIQQGIEKIERAQDLDEPTKKSIVALYEEAIKDLLRAATWKEKIDLFAQEKKYAAKNIEQTKASLRQTEGKTSAEVPADASVSQLENMLSETEAELTAAKEKLVVAEVEPRRRAIRLLEIKQLLKEARNRVTTLERQRDSLPTNGSGSPLEAAQRIRLLAALATAQLELEGYTKELEAQQATTDLLPLQHDLATREVALAEAKVKKLKERLSKIRQQEAQRQIREAKQEKAAMADPALRELANTNEKLAEKRQELINATKNSVERLAMQRKQFARLEKELKSVKDKVKSIGRTKTISPFLKTQRGNLPDTNVYIESMESRHTEILESQRWIFDLAEKRANLVDLEESLEAELKDAESEPLDRSWYDQKRVELALLQTQKKYVDQLAKDYYDYFNVLVDLDAVEQDLIDKVDNYGEYIDEQVLWIRSSFPIWEGDSWQGHLDAHELFVPGFWTPSRNVLYADLKNSTLLWVGTIIILGLLYSGQRQTKRKLRDLGRLAESSGIQRFWPTVEAAVLTVLLLVPITIALSFVAWRLTSGTGITESIRAIDSAIWAVVFIFLPVELFRQICCQQGLAESHFGWPSSAVARIRYFLLRIIVVTLPLVFITVILGNLQGQDTLGRLCFMATFCVIGLMMHFLLRKKGEVFRAFLAEQPDRRIRRIFFLIYLLMVVFPLLLMVIAAFGYYFTAWRLALRWLDSVALLISLLVMGAFFLRWVLVTRRRLAIQRARQEREEALASGTAALEGETADEQKITLVPDLGPDLATINMQTQRLLYVILGLTAALGLWFIWDDIFPAFGILKYVKLWQVSGDSPLAIGQTITMADLAWAILIAGLTFVAARNIPGLLEMSLLHRLPIDKGVRFATTTVFRYLLVAIGIIWACNRLGMSWSKVQWILAAMSVGLGFGLQEIFANFVSGMVILFERSIRIGDIITIGNATGKVSKIQMRATTIIDWDKKELVVPNKEFATGRLLNWTLTDSTNRLVLEVGVSYDSDPDQVREILLKCATEHPTVLDNPKPICIFREFSNSALMFSLRIYLATMKGRLNVIHEMHTSVHRALREAGITIAYPQLDMHVIKPPQRSQVPTHGDLSVGPEFPDEGTNTQ